MSKDPSTPQPPEALQSELVGALIAMRDSLVKLSILLNDVVFEGDVELRRQAIAQADASIQKLKACPPGARPESNW